MPKTVASSLRRFAFASRQPAACGSRLHGWGRAALAAVIVTTCLTGGTIIAAEAQWIWSPAYEKEAAPAGECYFRKSFHLGTPEHGEIQIGCDDRYDLYVNGRMIGSGKNWKVLDVYDITSDLISGTNVIAVKAVNEEQGSAGLTIRLAVKQEGGTHVSHSSDSTWKTSLREFIGWQKVRFNDSQWLAAREFGPVNATLPWGNEVTVAGAQERFKVLPRFRVEPVIDPKETGSLIAMTFDEFGQIIASRENGPLLVVRDQDRNGSLDSVSTFSEDVTGAQGLLSVSGKIFAVGTGADGTALYRLADVDRDGHADETESLLKFSGEMGEHGPHSLALGPDGLLYMVVGNFSKLDGTCESSSPYHHYYEGDLLKPRYEDASGHAVGITAPGGSILRTDTSATAVELVAGGLQNPYDLVFNRDGELFTADSDMEWDLGMTWYRPTRVNHVVPGAEFGWRSGWAKWPDYYFDSLPPMVEMGRGSPAGLEVYDHYMFPARYQNSLFVCDWSRGRIMVVKAKQHGATYKATSEIFLEGQPLNVTDLAVGPDGWLYFCTGGRDTEGGIYRVVWDGDVPDEVKSHGEGINAALKQPQLNSAWARQQVALIKRQLGTRWESELVKIAESDDVPAARRQRALDLLQLFGPFPSISLLIQISKDRQPTLRAKAAFLMGIHNDDRTVARLGEMLSDGDLLVQRSVCEALARSGQAGPVPKLVNLLGSSDRHVAFAARRALQQVARSEWQTAIMRTSSVRSFLCGAVALVTMYPDSEAIDPVLKRTSLLLKGYLNDQDFVDTIRLVEVSLSVGKLNGNNVPELRRQLAEEYPAKEVRMNRELIRVLAFLDEPTTAERVIEQLESDAPMIERLHTALCARFLTVGWTTPRRLAMLKFLEEARTAPGGHSYLGYIENVSRDYFEGLTEAERQTVLAGGARWPTSALSVLARLPDKLSLETLTELQKLDRQLKRVDGEPARKLRVGITAVLGNSRDPLAMAYLREAFDHEPDRRVAIAMALAQQPEGENWVLLVKSLGIVEGMAAQEILIKLAEVDRKPDDPEVFRQVIIRGLMLRENGGREASALLEKWTGQHRADPNADWDTTMASWQAWFAETYPDLPEPALPKEPEQSHWAYQELLSYLTGPEHAMGNASRGANVFEKAQCVKCHRMGQQGESLGPDLTTVSKRFQRKEILESILFPSQVISDQFATQTVVTNDGRTFSGMVSPTGDGSLFVLQANGEKIKLDKDQIAETKRAKHSAMPDGLLNTLTLDEVADLFAYLTKPPIVDGGKPGQSKTKTATKKPADKIKR